MASLTFYGGVGEIGGNKILLEDRGTRVLLDFGKSFGRRSRFYDEYLSPRTANGIGDFLEMGLLPDTPGMYREDLMRMAGRRPEKPDVDAVLLTHAHADHADYISFLHEDIPVYMGQTCHLLLKAIAEKSQRIIEREVIDFKPRPASGRDEPVRREIREFRTGDRVKIGSLEVEPVHVDHSVPGAYGFIIHTSAGPVVYTGDMRLHGTHPEMTDEFVRRAAEAGPAALVTEGTRVADPERDESEALVRSQCLERVSGTGGLVFADFNFKDVDRLMTFLGVARETGRRLAVKAADASFLKHLSQDPKLGVPGPEDGDVIIYKPKLKTGTYADSDYGRSERAFAGLPNAMTAEEIAREPGKALCAFGFYSFGALIDMAPDPGALYIHSASEPYSVEQELEQERIRAWTERFGMGTLQSHCSGHARGSDLLGAVAAIGARRVFPVHTERPERFAEAGHDVTIVREAERYEI